VGDPQTPVRELARTLLSSFRHQDLKPLKEVKQVIQLPIAGVISDGTAINSPAVKPHCQKSPGRFVLFSPSARSSKKGIYEVDRHALKKNSKKAGTGSTCHRTQCEQ